MDSYPFCKEAGIASEMLFNCKPFPPLPSLKKGLVLELNQIRKDNKMTWPIYKSWLDKILNCDSELYTVNALRKSTLALESQKVKLSQKTFDALLEDKYILPGRQPRSNIEVPQSLEQQVSHTLATEVVGLQQKISANEHQLALKDKEIDRVKSNSHNIKRKLKRKEEKISTLLSTIHSLKHEMKVPTKMKHNKSQASQLRYYKAKCSYLTSKIKTLECSECSECNKLDDIVKTLSEEKKELLEYNAQLRDQIKEAKKERNFFSEGKYSDDLRICIMELLTNNVGILKIEPVLRAVFKLLNIECNKLPQHTTINEILIESRSLAHAQIAEVLTTHTNNTLHSDGTTKFGRKYQSYQVSTEEGSLTLGLQVSSISYGRH